jgi:hypothetical protein
MATVNHGIQQHQGTVFSVQDFEHLLWDEGHDGWLNYEIIHAALLVLAQHHEPQDTDEDPRPIMMPAYEWQGLTASGTGEQLFSLINAHTAADLYIPVWLDNHWVLLVVRRDGKVELFDSAKDEARRRLILNQFTLLSNTPESIRLYGSRPWHILNTESLQQENGRDCGVWVIENARSMMNLHTPARTRVSTDSRYLIAQDIFDHLDARRGGLPTRMVSDEYMALRRAQILRTPRPQAARVWRVVPHQSERAPEPSSTASLTGSGFIAVNRPNQQENQPGQGKRGGGSSGGKR